MLFDIKYTLIKIYNLTIEILFPENLNCIYCKMPIHKNNKYSMCFKCYNEMIILNDVCPKCGKPFINLNLDKEVLIENCDFCKHKNFLFERNISIVEYNEMSKKMIFGLKYSKKTFYAKLISQIIIDKINSYYSNIIKEFDYISFVPLSKKREKERGFNQAKLITSYISQYFDITIVDCVERNKNTKKLHKLSEKDRSRELKNAFKICEGKKELIYNKNLIIVDDVFTTGSTMNEIAKVLKLSGVGKILSLSFATGKYLKDVTDE